jgi:hypothetical protein
MLHDARRALLSRILLALSGAPVAAALSGACGGKVDEPPVSSSSGGNQTASSSGGNGTGTGNSGTGTTPGSPSSTASPPPPPSNPEPLNCPKELRLEDRTKYPLCRVPDGGDAFNVPVCLPLPDDGSSCESRYSADCILARYTCGYSHGTAVVCAIPAADACCWQVEGGCEVGRPFIVDGHARLASLTEDAAWILPELAARLERLAAELDVAARSAIADVWSREGLAEHASIASFSRFILELLVLGAPEELVAAAHRAVADEIAHAERCFTLAAVYAGTPRGPGALETAGAFSQPLTLATFAARTASEGCIAETIAALQLHAAADAAREPAVASLLRRTAEEETEHALLAWRAVGWAIDAGGARVREAVAAVFARAASHVGFGPCPEDVDAAIDSETLRAHGVLSRRERHDLAVAALATVVGPASERLLAAHRIDAGSIASSNDGETPRRGASARVKGPGIDVALKDAFSVPSAE